MNIYICIHTYLQIAALDVTDDMGLAAAGVNAVSACTHTHTFARSLLSFYLSVFLSVCYTHTHTYTHDAYLL